MAKKECRFILVFCMTAFACGGSAQHTSKVQRARMAEAAEAPPGVSDLVPDRPKVKVERKVSRKAQDQFAETVKFFQRQRKKGWRPGSCAAAASKFESVATSHAKMVEAYFNAGVSYQQCNDVKEAEKLYKKALKVNPQHAASLNNLGEIYYSAGNKTVGIQYFNRAFAADKGNAGANNNLGWVKLMKLRKMTAHSKEWKRLEFEIRQHLSRALAVENNNIVSYTMLATVFMEGYRKNRSRLAVAELLLREGKKHDDKYAPLYNTWGLVHMARNKIGVALKQFEEAIQINPKFVEARMNVGQIVLSFRRYRDAEQHFRFVVDKKKGVSERVRYDATVSLGVALRGLKDIDGAEAMYKEAVKLDSSRGAAHYNLGVLWKEFRTVGSNQEQNREAYRKAKKHFSAYASKRGTSARRRRRAEDNVEDCEKAIKILTETIEFMKNMPKDT